MFPSYRTQILRRQLQVKSKLLIGQREKNGKHKRTRETPTRSPVAPHSETQCRHKGVRETGNVSFSCEGHGGGTPMGRLGMLRDPLFRSVCGVPLSTGPPHHDKVTGPRVQKGVEGGGGALLLGLAFAKGSDIWRTKMDKTRCFSS